MGFLYPDKKTEEMFDLEILEDFLFTQNKIEADLRAILAHLDDEEYGKKAKDGNKNLRYYTSELRGGLLTEAFTKACQKHATACYLSEPFNCIEDDMNEAWIKYEHILYPPYSDMATNPNKKLAKNQSLYLREKYDSYNKCVMPYYEFFKKTNEEKAKFIFGNLKKKLAKPIPLTEKEYSKLKRNDIVAVTQAAYGAMGEPGVMYIVTKYMDVYGIYIDAYEKMGNKFGLATIFNAHEVPSLKLMRDAEENSVEWYQFYTGFGNVLYVDHTYLPKAKEYILKTLGEKWSCPDLYAKRFDLIEYAILNTPIELVKKTKAKTMEENALFNIRENAPIEITPENIDEIQYDDILAIQYGTGRAQGESYGIIIAMKDLRVYHIHIGYYVHKYQNTMQSNPRPRISEKELYDKFPIIEQIVKCGAGSDKIEKGWNRIYMSIGFYLYVRDEIAEKFLAKVDEHEGRNRMGWLYGYWFDMLKQCQGIKFHHICEFSDIHDIIHWTISKKIDGVKIRDTYENIESIDDNEKRCIYQLTGKTDKPRYIVYDKEKDIPIYIESLSSLKRFL